MLFALPTCESDILGFLLGHYSDIAVDECLFVSGLCISPALLGCFAAGAEP